MFNLRTVVCYLKPHIFGFVVDQHVFIKYVCHMSTIYTNVIMSYTGDDTVFYLVKHIV